MPLTPGRCIWIEGLSAAGKTTLAKALRDRIGGFVIDGDDVRLGLNSDLGYSALDRRENMRRVAYEARTLADAGILPIVALTSPIQDLRNFARSMFRPGSFIEVYLDIPISVCASRDVKGLYNAYRGGYLSNLVGEDIPFDEPQNPEVKIYASDTVEMSVDKVLEALNPHLESAGAPRIRGNDWQSIPRPASGAATGKVSVVIPYYQGPRHLERILSALEWQTYPGDLTEIIVVDDGSQTPLNPDDFPSVTVLRQETVGFGASKARNYGAEVATGDILIFLDMDVIPHPLLIEIHARWHDSLGYAVTLGNLLFLDDGGDGGDDISVDDLPKLFDGPLDSADYPEFKHWRHWNIVHSTEFLTRGGDIIHCAMQSSNFGIRRDLFLELGGFREESVHYGMEDTEFGYRIYASGLVFIPVMDLYSWHVGSQDARLEGEKSVGMEVQKVRMEQYLPTPRFRNACPGRTFKVPEFVVIISGSNLGIVTSIVFDLLSESPWDIVIFVDTDDPLTIMRLSGNDCVRIGPASVAFWEYKHSPIFVQINSSCILRRKLLKNLKRYLGSHAMLKVNGATGHIFVTRSWARNRAQFIRCGIYDVGTIKTVPMRKFVGKHHEVPDTKASAWDRIIDIIKSSRGPKGIALAVVYRIKARIQK